MAWKKAKDAAWREFGRRYWKAVLTLEVVRRSGPALLAGLAVAALAFGVWWLVTHVPSPSAPNLSGLDVPGRWWWWLLGAALVAGVGMWSWRRARDPFRVPARYRPGRIRRRVVAGLAVVGAVVAVLIWREA